MLKIETMRYLVATIFALSMMFGFSTNAKAQESKFQVQSVKATAAGIELSVATDNGSKPSTAKFFLNPSVDTSNMIPSSATLIDTIDLKAGREVRVIKIPKATLAKLGYKTGQTIQVMAQWPGYGHTWGTGSWKLSKTSFVVPDASKVRTKAKAAAGKAPVVTKAPKYNGPGMPLQYEASMWTGAVPGKKANAATGETAVRGKAGKPLHDIAVHAKVDKLSPLARNFTTAGSAIESEGKVGFAKKRDLRIATSLFNKMARDPKLAAKVLGKGWSIQKQAAYTFKDKYLDNNKTREFAKVEAGLRHRTVPGSGQPSKLNFKDEGGLRSGKGKVVASRLERHVDLGPKANLAGIVTSDSYLNPLKGLKDKGKDTVQYLDHSASVSDQRTRYQLMYKEPGKRGAQPAAVAEISMDHVFDYRAEGAPNAKHQRVTFFGMEVDIAHQPVNSTGVAGDYIDVKSWTPTHKVSQLKHLKNDPSMKKAYTVIEKMMDHLSSKGVRLRATVPKYTEGLIRSGVIKPTTQMQKRILNRSRTSFYKGPAKAKAKAKAKAPARAARVR